MSLSKTTSTRTFSTADWAGILTAPTCHAVTQSGITSTVGEAFASCSLVGTKASASFNIPALIAMFFAVQGFNFGVGHIGQRCEVDRLSRRVASFGVSLESFQQRTMSLNEVNAPRVQHLPSIRQKSDVSIS